MNQNTRTFARATCAVALCMFASLPALGATQNKVVEIYPQLEHSETVQTVTFSRDGRMIASGSFDGTIKLWDAASGRGFRSLSGHSGVVGISAFSPDGRMVVSVGSGDKTVKLWDVASGQELKTLRDEHGVMSVALSRDGRTIALSSFGGTIKLWDVASGHETKAWRGGAGILTFSPDGRTLASVDGITIKLWDVASGREIKTLSGHSTYVVQSIAFSPDGRKMASVNLDTLKIWDLASGNEIKTVSISQANSINSVAFSPDGRTLVSGGGDKTLKLWDVASGRELRTLSGHSFSVNAVAFSPDGRTIASGSSDNTVRLWDMVSGQNIKTLGGNTTYIGSVAFSPDRQMIAARTGNGLKLWDAVTGREIRSLVGHAASIRSYISYSDGRTLAAVEGDSTKLYSIKLWDIASGREIRTIRANRINTIAFSPDGRSLAVSEGDSIKLWDIASGRELHILGGYNSLLETITWSPDSRLIASRIPGKTIKFWDTTTGRELRTMSGHAEGVSSVAFSPDGRTVALGRERDTLDLLDVASGRKFRTLSGLGYVVQAVAFSPDGRALVSGNFDGIIVLSDVESGRKLKILSGHRKGVTSIAFSSDGRMMMSGGSDGTIRLWDSASNNEIVSIVNFKDGEWITITPEGYYTGSENADKYLNVRIGNKVYGIDQYREKFYRPEAVMAALAGKPITGLASLGSVKPAPSVSIVDTPASVGSDETTVKVKVADQGGGVGDVRVYLNGSAVSLERRNLAVAAVAGKAQVFSYKVRLVSGKNAIRAIAFNAENSMQSTDALHEIEARIAAQKPSLYAVVVGIQEYVNPKLTLKYSVADANLFADTIKAKAGGLFEKVEVTRLVTAKDTTNAAIAEALKSVRAKVRPDDLFVFYVASHGTVDEGEYYLVTSNVGSTSTEKLKRDALSQNSLKELIANIPATKKLIVLDTCNAGKLGDSLQVALLTRGMNEDTAFKILSRAVGSTILSAATSQQEALEGYQNHGLFTWVLAEGLNGAADLDKDGFIKTIELASYVDEKVPELAEKVFRHKQFPVVAPSGQAFPIVRAK